MTNCLGILASLALCTTLYAGHGQLEGRGKRSDRRCVN